MFESLDNTTPVLYSVFVVVVFFPLGTSVIVRQFERQTHALL